MLDYGSQSCHKFQETLVALKGRFLKNVGILTCSRAIRLLMHVQDNTNVYMQIVQLAMTLVHADFLLLRASNCVRHVIVVRVASNVV